MADKKVTSESSPEVHEAPPHDQKVAARGSDPEISRAENVDLEDALKKDHMDYDRVDKEVAKYANGIAIDVSPEENSRLKRLVDRRVSQHHDLHLLPPGLR
jgi:hypothetical protein